MIKKAITEYEYLVDRINESGSIDKMREVARNIQTFAKDLLRKERAYINSLMVRSKILLVFAIFVILIVETVINIKLAQSIASPVRNLEEITKRGADRDFSGRIEIKGRDELSTLGASFN